MASLDDFSITPISILRIVTLDPSATIYKVANLKGYGDDKVLIACGLTQGAPNK